MLLLSAVFFTACKKDKPVLDPQKEIIGNWVGKYSSTNNPVASFFRVNIKANGKMEIVSEQNEVLAAGTYTLTGDVVMAMYTYFNGGDTYNFSGKYVMATKKITGSWGEDDIKAGDFFLDKQ